MDARQDVVVYLEDILKNAKNERNKAELKSKKIFKFCTGVALAFSVCGISLCLVSILPINLQDKMLNKNGYITYNQEYRETQKQAIADKVYSKDLSIDNYQTEVEKIEDYSKDLFASQNFTESELEQYHKQQVAETHLLATGGTLVGGSILSAISATLGSSYYDNKKKKLNEKIVSLSNQLNMSIDDNPDEKEAE